MTIDVVAGILIMAGALLALLGSVGLLRFPDALTRMHASTKAATVGVIAIVAATAIETGTAAGLLTLLLVVVLLFLSAPLGVSLLARAAYRDPETPRLPRTRGVTTELPEQESTPARRVRGTGLSLAVWLWAVWIGVSGRLEADVLIGGAAAAGAVAYGMRMLAPRWPAALRRPIGVARFIGHFTRELVAASWDVILAILRSPAAVRPAVVEVPVRATSRNEVTLLMNAISFTPGTIALDLRGDHLLVHVLDADDLEAVAEEIATMEDRIVEAFGGSAAESDGDGT